MPALSPFLSPNSASSSTGTIGSPRQWARDLAIVGGASSFSAPYLVVGTHFGASYLVATTVAGLGFGALLGALVPVFLTGKLARIPVWALLLAGPLFGATWGALVGGSAGMLG